MPSNANPGSASDLHRDAKSRGTIFATPSAFHPIRAVPCAGASRTDRRRRAGSAPNRALGRARRPEWATRPALRLLRGRSSPETGHRDHVYRGDGETAAAGALCRPRQPSAPDPRHSRAGIYEPRGLFPGKTINGATTFARELAGSGSMVARLINSSARGGEREASRRSRTPARSFSAAGIGPMLRCTGDGYELLARKVWV